MADESSYSRDPEAGPDVAFDRRYEWRAVALLSISFGLVGLDRWILPPLFPAMMKDLALDYADLGAIVGVLALSWGVCSIVFGRMSDRIGRRRLIIPAMIGFSLLSGLTGAAGGLGMLLLVRAAMGAAEGAFSPAAIAATAEASHPRRRGMNQGIMLSCFALLGFGLAPIIATQLMAVVSSWRLVFLIVGVPGLIFALLLHRVLREPPHLAAGAPPAPDNRSWGEVLKSANIRMATGATFCTMSCVVVVGAMVPSYLVDWHHLSIPTMGLIMSALGWGGFAGEILVPGFSDLAGRRPAALLAGIGSLVSVWLFTLCGSDALPLFLALFAVAFFAIGLLALLTGPVATEAVPPALTSSAIGFVSGAGEIFGGGIAPFAAGFIAARYGIEQVFWVPMAGLTLGLVIAFALRETAPGPLARRGARSAG